MNKEFYDNLQVGETILGVLEERSLVSESFATKERSLIQEEKEFFGVVLEENQRWHPEREMVTSPQGEMVPFEAFYRVWTDYERYPTTREVFHALGLNYEYFSGNERHDTSRKKYLNKYRDEFAKKRPEITNDERKVSDDVELLPNFAWREEFYQDVNPDTSVSDHGPNKHERRNVGKNSIYGGDRGRKVQTVERINSEEILPGEFYTNLTRIPKSNQAHWLKFWERDVASVASDRGPSLFGRKWAKSFVFGYQLTEGLLYEVWYNSIDSTFSLHDQNGADVTGQRYQTLQETTKALFNAIVQNARTDQSVHERGPTAASLFASVGQSIDPHVQKMAQREHQSAKELETELDKLLSNFDAEQKKYFNTQYDDAFVDPEIKIQAAQKYVKGFEKIKKLKNNAVKEALLSQFFDIHVNDWIQRVNSAFEKEVGIDRKSSSDVTSDEEYSNYGMDDISPKEKEKLSKKLEKIKKAAMDKADDAQVRAKLAAIDLGKDFTKSYADNTKEVIKKMKSASKEAKDQINKAAEQDPDFKKHVDPVRDTRDATPDEENQMRQDELDNVASLLGNKAEAEKNQILKKYKRIDNVDQFVEALRKMTYLVIDTFASDLDKKRLKRKAMNIEARYLKSIDAEPEHQIANQFYDLANAATDSINTKKAMDQNSVEDSDEFKLFEDVRESFEDALKGSSLDDDIFSQVSKSVDDQHGNRMLKQMREKAKSETMTQGVIQKAVNENLIEAYFDTTRANEGMMPNWLEKTMPSLLGIPLFKARRDPIVDPRDAKGGVFVRAWNYVRGRTYKASFVAGFSLSGGPNLEVWYITEPNPDASARSKTISSFAVFDVTSMRLIRQYIPYYRNAVQLMGTKIALGN